MFCKKNCAFFFWFILEWKCFSFLLRKSSLTHSAWVGKKTAFVEERDVVGEKTLKRMTEWTEVVLLYVIQKERERGTGQAAFIYGWVTRENVYLCVSVWEKGERDGKRDGKRERFGVVVEECVSS